MADKEMIAATLAPSWPLPRRALTRWRPQKRRQAFISRSSINSNAKPKPARPSRPSWRDRFG